MVRLGYDFLIGCVIWACPLLVSLRIWALVGCPAWASSTRPGAPDYEDKRPPKRVGKWTRPPRGPPPSPRGPPNPPFNVQPMPPWPPLTPLLCVFFLDDCHSPVAPELGRAWR